MRYFALFLGLSIGSNIFCASSEKGLELAKMRDLVAIAVIGQSVDQSFVERFSDEAYLFNKTTGPQTKVAVHIGNKWIYGELKQVLDGSSAAVKTTQCGGCIFSLDELRNLLPNSSDG